jgi:uncharacterized protein (DUF885 family)
MASRDFEDLSRSIMDEILSWDPSFATQLGWHKYDHEVMDPRQSALDRQRQRLSDFITTMEAFDAEGLSEDQELDRDLAVYLFRLRTFEITRLRIHEQMSIAEEEIGRSLFFLFARDYLPLETRIEAMISRLEKTPLFLDRARTVLVKPCGMWNEIAAETGKRLPMFLNTIRQMGMARLENGDQMIRLSSAIEVALNSINSYEDWLVNDVLPRSKPISEIGATDYEEFMRLKEFGVSPEEALEIANLGLKATSEQRKKLAAEMAPSGLLKDAIRTMKEDHPKTFEAVLKAYRDKIEEARTFVLQKKLVTVPEGERLVVVETPHFMRHIAPFAAQYEPGKYCSDMKGLFLVTPDEGNLELLKEHCHAMIANTAVHEGYPGHHIQGIHANSHPSHIRTLSTAPCFAEGWALYCERLMIEEGFQRSATHKLAQLNDLVFRIARVTADVSLARKTMSAEEVADMLVAQTGMERQAALNEAKSYTYAMTQYLSYFIGMLRLLQLREDVERALGERFDLKAFHDSILSAGCLPVHYMRRVERIRLKRDFGVDLPHPEESLLEFTRRLAARPEPF